MELIGSISYTPRKSLPHKRILWLVEFRPLNVLVFERR